MNTPTRTVFLRLDLLSAATAALCLAACGGAPAADKVASPGVGSGSAAAPAGDISFEVAAVEIKGTVFGPLALGRPGMPLVEAKKKVPLDKQRAVVKATKDPVQREAQAAILATMLYQLSKPETDKAKEQALLAEARQALADAADNSKDKVDEITLRLLATYDMRFEDYAAAATHWQALVDKAPKDKEAPFNRAWWVLSLLLEDKNAEAKAALADQKPEEAQPELAYVIAWTRWRTGDAAGAWQALQTAARGWKAMANKDVVDRELLLFAARTGVAVDEVVPVILKNVEGNYAAALQGAKSDAKKIADVEKAKKLDQYAALYNLSQALGFAGRTAEAATAVDKALALAGADVPGTDVPMLRLGQAKFTVTNDDPTVAQGYAKQAIDALASCAKCADKDKQAVIGAVHNIGTLFHALYATANDHRYYEAAKVLYELSVDKIADAAAKAEAQKVATQLETTLKNKKVGTGTHDKGVLASLLGLHNQEVQACLEVALLGSRKVAGGLTLNLEVEASGKVKGVATDPKGGLTDVAAVASCVAERAKGWKLPARDMPGTTRIKLAYTLAPATPATPTK
jgi:hypothetical protein